MLSPAAIWSQPTPGLRFPAPCKPPAPASAPLAAAAAARLQLGTCRGQRRFSQGGVASCQGRSLPLVLQQPLRTWALLGQAVLAGGQRAACNAGCASCLAVVLSGAHSKLLECCHLTGLRQASARTDLSQTCRAICLCPAHCERPPMMGSTEVGAWHVGDPHRLPRTLWTSMPPPVRTAGSR